MENYTGAKKEVVTNGFGFKEGKVFEDVLNIMEELKVPRNGKELDKDTGEVLFTYIKIEDLREALKPLLIKNKCMIRKVSAVKCYRDRKQNKWGTWVNIDVVENQYILQSLEDGSYIVGTGRGEGSDWGNSSVTLAEADAYKNFIGSTFCLVTDDESKDDNNKEELESDKKKKELEVEKADSEIRSEKEVKTELIIKNPVVKLEAPVPSNEVVKSIDKNIDCEKDGGVPLELPKEAFDNANAKDKPISVESIATVEPIEHASENESVAEEAEPEESTEEIIGTESIEPTEEMVASDDEIKAYANVICPVKGKAIVGKTFEVLCEMAVSNTSDDEMTARRCICYVATHQENFMEKTPEFAKACILAVEKFNFIAA